MVSRANEGSVVAMTIDIAVNVVLVTMGRFIVEVGTRSIAKAVVV